MSREAGETVRPHEPGHEHPPRRPRSFWKTYGIRRPVGIACALVLLFATLAAGVLIFVPRIGTGARMESCGRNLRFLGRVLAGQVEETGAFPAEGGAALLLRWRREGRIPRGREYLLLCSLDQAVQWPRTDAGKDLYDLVDLEDPVAIAPLCSYAVRDFARYPVDPDGTDPETGDVAWIACDRQGRDGRTQHHPKGLSILFADGNVRFVRKGVLGFGVEERVVVGPDSPHPELRKLVFFATEADGPATGTTPR